MASPCWICPLGQTLVTSYKGLLDDSVKQKKYKGLKANLLKIATGGGQNQETPLDVVSNKFMQSQYPDAKSNTYWWPSVFEFEHPGESSDVTFSMDKDSTVPGLTNKEDDPIRYGTVQRKRRGEDPEETVFTTICSMLQAKKIPSFLIHGYKWNKSSYPHIIKKMYRVDGELDIVISLPGNWKCVLSIEVKGVCMKDALSDAGVKDVTGVKKVITKAFGQCENALMYVSMVSNDLFHDKNIPFIKVAALPNCSRDDFQEEQICKKCSKYVITKDELENIKELHKWFSAVTGVIQSHQVSTDFDGDLHEKVIGRLLGPKCLVEENRVPASLLSTFKPVGVKNEKRYGIAGKAQTVMSCEQITEEYGTVEKVHARWFQLNQEQLDVITRDEKLLWLTGEPGSGKTLLFWKKIEEILCGYDEDHAGEKFTVIVIPGNGNDLLYKKYQYQFAQLIFPDSCDLCIENFCDDNPFRPKTPKLPTCNILPKVIEMYQDKRKEGVLHIFIDESDWLLKGTDQSEFDSDWGKLDLQRLGFVWVIQNPLSTNDDEVEKLLPGFKKVHLKHVMRMTKEAVRFVSHMLNRELVSGHGVAGHLPVLYRMACVCRSSVTSDLVHCGRCIHKRQVLLIVKILKDFKVSWKEKSRDGLSISDFAILMTETHKKHVDKIMEKYTTKFPHRSYKEIIISYSSYFRGCEEKIVIMDLSDPAIKIENLMECLTRCLSQLVLMDTGIDHPDNKKDYEFMKEKISTATDLGLITIKDITREEIDEEEVKFILKLK